ncbi:MAG: zinc-binding alcohol dehydrogenase family protein [Rhodospirillales bacterium]|jgi:acryloyl-coenzyme A reductase
MRAVMMRAQGAPDVLKVENVAVPEIRPNEVLVKVEAAGVSYHDVVERNGAYTRGLKLPMILGYEIAGKVEQVGAAVTTLKVGDRVCNKPFHSCGLCRRCRTGMETACEKRRGVRGGYAEYVALAEEVLVTVPDSIGGDAACMIGPTTAVALNAVRDTAHVTLGDRVLVTGASGGLGLPSIELARAAGASVIALTRSAAKRDRLIAMGADHVVVADDGADFSEAVKAITGGDGVEVVIDNVGSRVFTPCFKSLAVGGRYAFVGQLMREEISINPARIFFKRARFLGVGSARRDQLEDAVRLVAAGKVTPIVAEILPLEAAAEAHAKLEAGEVVGRIVLRP